MAWERGYYYQVRRENGRVVREYLGKGFIATLAAERDSDNRMLRTHRQRQERFERDLMKTIDDEVEEVNEIADLLARAALLLAGYRQHNRGKWRRKCVNRND